MVHLFLVLSFSPLLLCSVAMLTRAAPSPPVLLAPDGVAAAMVATDLAGTAVVAASMVAANLAPTTVAAASAAARAGSHCWEKGARHADAYP